MILHLNPRMILLQISVILKAILHYITVSCTLILTDVSIRRVAFSGNIVRGVQIICINLIREATSSN